MASRNNDRGDVSVEDEMKERIKINEYMSNLPKMFESIDAEIKAAVIPPNADEETKRKLYAELEICKDNVMTKIMKALEMSATDQLSPNTPMPAPYRNKF